MSRYRPLAPILVVTRNSVVAAQIHLWRGCFPLHYPEPRDLEMAWMEDVDRRVKFAVAVSVWLGNLIFCSSYSLPDSLPFKLLKNHVRAMLTLIEIVQTFTFACLTVEQFS